MKFKLTLKAVLLTGVLTTIAAVGSLTVALPQSAQAGKKIYICRSPAPPCPQISETLSDKQDALARCNQGWSCSVLYGHSNETGAHFCGDSSVSCLPLP